MMTKVTFEKTDWFLDPCEKRRSIYQNVIKLKDNKTAFIKFNTEHIFGNFLKFDPEKLLFSKGVHNKQQHFETILIQKIMQKKKLKFE